MADRERVIYLVCLADNVGVPQAIPQRVLGAVFAYCILTGNAAKVLACCVVPLFAVGSVTARVLIAGNVKPWELGHSAQRRLMRVDCQPVVNVCRSGQSAAYTRKPMAAGYGRRKA